MQLHSTRAIPLDDCRYSACFNHDPGLGFYGGMVGKNVISTMLQSFMAMIIVTILWVVIGFGLSFGPSIGGIIGILYLFFQSVGPNSLVFSSNHTVSIIRFIPS
jgi:ammonia channel protein AmtB